MKNTLLILITLFTGIVCLNTSCNKEDDIRPGSKGEVTTIDDYTLVVKNKDSTFSHDTRQWMENVFFMVYPKELERFNLNAPSKVVFIIDPQFNQGKAKTEDSTITFNPQWLKSHPNDIDLVTRQLMFVVGNYPENAPSWITNGIADYARYIYGVDNKGAGWILPDFVKGQNYKDSSKVTARFFVWMELRVEHQIMDDLNKALRNNTYTDSLWKNETGRSLDELWDLYEKDPSITTTASPAVFARLAEKAQASLMKQFWSVKEHYFTTNNHGNLGYNYWWNAHGLDVIIDHYLRTKDDTYKTDADLIYQGMYSKNGNTFMNTYNDDMSWMALACLRAYDATHLNQYKVTADELWKKIKESWSDVLGGGITWKTDDPNMKNAPTNGPAAILAARLYEHDLKKEDLEWAKKIFAWENDSLVVDPSTGVVWDYIKLNNDSSIHLDAGWTYFTYNQGTYIGAATELYRITKDSSYLKKAITTANTVVNDAGFSPGGILKGEGQGDGGLFKGIFIRYFNDLILSGYLKPATQKQYVNYMITNGRSLMNNASQITANGVIFNPDWTNPSNGQSDASVQLSGVMLYEALAQLQRNGLVN